MPLAFLLCIKDCKICELFWCRHWRKQLGFTSSHSTTSHTVGKLNCSKPRLNCCLSDAPAGYTVSNKKQTSRVQYQKKLWWKQFSSNQLKNLKYSKCVITFLKLSKPFTFLFHQHLNILAAKPCFLHIDGFSIQKSISHSRIHAHSQNFQQALP